MPDDLDGQILITLDGQRLSASVHLKPGIQSEMLTKELIYSLLTERNVSSTVIDNAKLTSLIESYCPTNTEPVEAVIAVGEVPVHGKNGWIELEPDLVETLDRIADKPPPSEDDEPEPSASGDDEEDQVSFYEQSAFCVVETGRKLGRVFPPTDGLDGLDVTGVAIAAKAGKRAGVKVDKTVHLDDKGDLFAKVSGALQSTSELISVLCELRIDGNIDFSTGNVVGFMGDVEVTKSIRDRFRVDIGGSLTVGELVEAADLKTGRDVTLLRGMAGREKGTVEVGRDMFTCYADSMSGSIARDCIPSKELTNVSLSIGRNLVGKTCVVIGGSLNVLRCCEAAQFGSEGEASTEVILGKLPGAEDLARQAVELLPKLDKQLARFKNKLNQLQAATQRLTVSQREEMTELIFNVSTTENMIRPLVDQVRAITGIVDQLIEPSLIAHSLICAGVTLWIGQFRCEFGDQVKGPVRIDLDDKGEPQVTDLKGDVTSPLSKYARVVPDDRFVDLAALKDLLTKDNRQSNTSAKAA